AVGGAHVAELGREHDPIAPACERPADQFLVLAAAVHVGGVDHGHAEIDGAVHGRDALALVRPAVDRGHAHAAEADGRDAQWAELSRLHDVLPSVEPGLAGPGLAGNAPLPNLPEPGRTGLGSQPFEGAALMA